MKTANLAIVFTDIKGFTERTSRQTLGENQRLLERHERLLVPLFHAFGGRIIKSIGDAFMVTFESPTQAVLCGAAIQDRLWLHNRSALDDERIEVRVAMNVGEVRVENKDVFGEPVNIAARVEGITAPGEVFFTEAVYLAMNKAEVPAEEVGSFELKGIPGKVKVYRVPRAPYRVEAPAPTPTGVSSGELPPFGNLGLARLTDPGGVVRSRAAGLSLRRLRPGVLIGLAVALIGLGLGVSLAFRSEESAAVSAVRGASDAERSAKLRAAREVIAKVKDPGERAWWNGQLVEALGDTPGALGHYRTAVRAGSSRAQSRLIDLLEDDACEVRSSAARTLGELKVKAARGALKDLSVEGGRDDGSGGGLLGKVFGCDSKAAAAEALKLLE